jgi:hypothetical protein
MILQIRRDREAHHVGLDGDLPMAAVDQGRQAHARRTPQVADGVERGTDRPAREQDVVDQHHLGPVQVKRDIGPSQHRPPLGLPEIIAIQSDVDGTDFDLFAEQPAQLPRQPLGQWDAARADADQAETHAGPATIGKLASYRGNQAADLVGIAQPLFASVHHDDLCAPGLSRPPPTPAGNVAETHATFQAHG